LSERPSAQWHGTRFSIHQDKNKEDLMLGTILIIILVLLLLGALPRWGHSRNWGYRPTGILGILLIVVVILLLTGRL